MEAHRSRRSTSHVISEVEDMELLPCSWEKERHGSFHQDVKNVIHFPTNVELFSVMFYCLDKALTVYFKICMASFAHFCRMMGTNLMMKVSLYSYHNFDYSENKSSCTFLRWTF